MPAGYYGNSHQAYRTTAPGDAPSLNTHSVGRRTSTPSTSTDNLKLRRPPGPRRACSPSKGQPAPPPPLLLSQSLASSSFFLSEPASPRTAAGPPYPSGAAVTATPTLPSVAASSATRAVAASATVPLSGTLTTAYPATDAPGPDPSNRESFISILDDPFFLRYDYDPTSDSESPAFSRPSDPPRSAANHQLGGDENAASPGWPPPRRESLTINPSSYLVCWICRRFQFFCSAQLPALCYGCNLPV